MKTRSLVVAALTAAWLLFPISGAKAQETECTESTEPGEYESVVVPEGEECDLSESTVKGSVVVKPGGMLHAGRDGDGATIGEGINADQPGWIDIHASTIGGNVRVTGTQSSPSDGEDPNALCDGTEIKGNLEISGSGEEAAWRVGKDPESNFLTELFGEPCSDGVLVSGNATTDGNLAKVEIVGNGALDDDPPRGFEGDLSVTNNKEVQVEDNDVAGTLTCEANADGNNEAQSDTGGCASAEEQEEEAEA